MARANLENGLLPWTRMGWRDLLVGVPADDWAAHLAALTVCWEAELRADWADELELTLNSRLTDVIGRRRLAADGWDGLLGGEMLLAGWSDGRSERLTYALFACISITGKCAL